MQSIYEWLGREQVVRSDISPEPMRRLSRALWSNGVQHGHGQMLPLLWQWLFFLAETARDDTGPDGHPVRGDFMPPIGLQRRMFAGGSARYVEPLIVGSEATRVRRIEKIEEKHGRSGALVIVTTRDDITGDSSGHIVETQQIVYTDSRPREIGPARRRPVPSAPWASSLATDEVLLFRFSALTYNSHRIHYDRAYATNRERYPDLVVQGPLTAIALAGLFNASSGAHLRKFRFRAKNPIFVGDVIELRGWPEGTTARLAAYRSDGVMAMEATASSIADGDEAEEIPARSSGS